MDVSPCHSSVVASSGALSSPTMEEGLQAPDSHPWWRERNLSEGTGHRLVLGSLRLGLFHAPGEWLLARETLPQSELDPELILEPVSDPSELTGEIERFALDRGGDVATIVPVVADRSLIARPRLPLHVPPNQAVTVFVSSPVWLQVSVGDPPLALPEIPVHRLSDTWFGSSTREGELAYALGTQARVRLEQVPSRPHHMITPVTIENSDGSMLRVDRLSLPIPFLSVFADQENRLWTEGVRFRSRPGYELVDFEIAAAPEQSLGIAQRVTGPRRIAEKNLLVRAFSSLLKPFGGES